MELTPDQFQQLEQALIAAYPSETKLGRMVFYTFGKRLNVMAKGEDHTDLIFNLLDTVNSQGEAAQLIRGAHRTNSTNDQLKAFCEVHGQCLLEDACSENLSGFDIERVHSLVGLLRTDIPMSQISDVGLAVLPSGASDDRLDPDLTDFKDEQLVRAIRLCGFLKLAIVKFSKVKEQPTLLLFARELHSALAAASPAKAPLFQWIQQAAAECGFAAQRPLAHPSLQTKRGTLEVSLMITVRRYSKQLPGKPLRYQVNGCLYFDRIVGHPLSLSVPPAQELTLPKEAQGQLGVMCPWKQVPKRTEQFLEEATYLLTHQLKRELGYQAHKLTVEMFLPVNYMGVAVDQWPRSSRQVPLGKDYGLIVRCCDRLDDDERYNEICLAWSELQEILQLPNGINQLHDRIESPNDFSQYPTWKTLEAKLKQKLGLKWCCGLPDSEADQKRLFEAILYGDIPVAVWTRSADILDVDSNPLQPLDLSNALVPFLEAECFHNPVILSKKLKEVRSPAWAEESEEKKGRCLGDHIAFLLDNPNRLPLHSPFAS